MHIKPIWEQLHCTPRYKLQKMSAYFHEGAVQGLSTQDNEIGAALS